MELTLNIFYLSILGHSSYCVETHLGIEVKVGLSDLESQALIVKMELPEYDLDRYLVSGLTQQGRTLLHEIPIIFRFYEYNG